MSEPDYLAQTGEPMSPDEAHAWWSARIDDAKRDGCRWVQVSVNPNFTPNLWLVEAWKLQQLTYGAPRWQLTHLKHTEPKPDIP